MEVICEGISNILKALQPLKQASGSMFTPSGTFISSNKEQL